MKSKKMIGMTALLGVTAMTSAFAGTPTAGTVHGEMTKGKRGSKETRVLTEAEKTEHDTKLATALASALGTTKENILLELKANKSPRDIIKASGQDAATIEAKLQALRLADLKVKLEESVASGKITREKANELLLKGEGGHFGKGGDRALHKEKMLTAMSSILSVPVATLQAEISSGKTPLAIVKASGMSEADFEAKMKAFHLAELKTELQAKVVAGTLTQADADKKIAEMASRKMGMKGMNGTSFSEKKGVSAN